VKFQSASIELKLGSIIELGQGYNMPFTELKSINASRSYGSLKFRPKWAWHLSQIWMSDYFETRRWISNL